MFFPRMRRHAKWMFVLLALFMGGGFVLFGVGAGGIGVGELFRGDGTSGDTPSISEARDKVEKNPKDAQAQRDLATAFQLEGRTDESITALEAYTKLRPADGDALRELAGLYLSSSAQHQQRAQFAQLDAASVTGGSIFTEPLQIGEGQTLGQDPITEAVAAQANTIATEAYAAAQAANTKALDAYQRLAKAEPEDAGIQLELAQTAQTTGDTAAALAAYKRFLELAPDDPSAELVREQIKQLESPTGTSSTG
jgi:DNA-binding SARP family transcriptional activator